jgi:hypothetical protein
MVQASKQLGQTACCSRQAEQSRQRVVVGDLGLSHTPSHYCSLKTLSNHLFHNKQGPAAQGPTSGIATVKPVCAGGDQDDGGSVVLLSVLDTLRTHAGTHAAPDQQQAQHRRPHGQKQRHSRVPGHAAGLCRHGRGGKLMQDGLPGVRRVRLTQVGWGSSVALTA